MRQILGCPLSLEIAVGVLSNLLLPSECGDALEGCPTRVESSLSLSFQML